MSTLASSPEPVVARAPSAAGPAVLSVVVPTFNEIGNIEPVVAALTDALSGIEWEVVFVDDDSPDGTAQRVREIGRVNPRVRCVQRIQRRGLSTAVIEGILASSAPFVAVMDGDLQHDPALLPHMLDALQNGGLDIVVGSRYVAGGNVSDWNSTRASISRVATRLARLVVTAELTDPMSGFFMLTRPAFERASHRLSGQGFKILLDLFASALPAFRFRELPYSFRDRHRGYSKLDSSVAWDYATLLLDKLLGRYIPVRFVLFAAVGGIGVAVHLAALRLGLSALSFRSAQAIATLVAMSTNFALNNAFTYRDRRLKGVKFLLGLLSFIAVCSVGAVANVGIATAVFERRYAWWLSGLAGAAVGAAWNYTVSSNLTWRQK